MTTLVMVLAMVAVAAVVAAFVTTRRHPERSATHVDSERETTSDRLYGKADRPAGPDAETMDPDRLGGDPRPPT
jgi:hypothetical protein